MDTPIGDPHRGKRVAGQILVYVGIVFGIFSLLGFLFSGAWTGSDALSAMLGTALIAGMPLAIGLFILRKAGDAPPLAATPPGQLAPLSGVRIFFVVVAALIMLFSGGCTLLFLGSMLFASSGPDNYVTAPVVLIFGGPPFIAGLIALLIALKAGRPRGS